MNQNKPERFNRKGIRLWFGLMIVGPALLLLYFLFQGNHSTDLTPKNHPLPAQTFQLGTPVEEKDGLYIPAPNGKVFFQQELNLPNNTIAAEAGYIFLQIPLVFPTTSPVPSSEYWQVLDEAGHVYPLLKTLPPPKDFTISMPQESTCLVQIFKVGKDSSHYYLLYTKKEHETAWDIPKQ